MNQHVGNLPPMPGVFPDYPAPVVRNAGAERELTMMRWGIQNLTMGLEGGKIMLRWCVKLTLKLLGKNVHVNKVSRYTIRPAFGFSL